MTAGGGQGGSPRHPPPHNPRKIARAHKNFLRCAQKPCCPGDFASGACFPGSECGVTPLPQFPRPSRPQCLPQPAAAGVKFRFLPTRPGWVGRTALYHPVIAAAQPAPCHPSPQAGVPLGGENSSKGEVDQKRSEREATPADPPQTFSLRSKARGPRVWSSRFAEEAPARGTGGFGRSGQKENPHRRRTKKRKGNRWKEAGTSAHGNGARQRTIPPRRGAKNRRMEFVKEVCFLLGAKIVELTLGEGGWKSRRLVQKGSVRHRKQRQLKR